MFGYDDRDLQRIRDRRPINRWIVGFELFVLVVGLFVLGTTAFLTTPAGIQMVVNRFVGDAPFSVTVADATMLPMFKWHNPETWRLSVEGLEIVPLDPKAPTVKITRVYASLPELAVAWASRRLHFDRLDATGLEIYVKHQGAGKEWTAKKTALEYVSARELYLWDGEVHIAKDGPLAAIDVELLRGKLHDVEYAPGSREVSGSGELTARRFSDGDAVLRSVRVGRIWSDRSNLEFDHTTFRFADGKGTLSGKVDHFTRKAALTLNVGLEGVDAGAIFSTATGNVSPLHGPVDAQLTVHAGGDLGKGNAWMEGTVKLASGVIQLPEAKKKGRGWLMTALRLAPYIEVDDTGQILLGDMTGDIWLTRGAVEVRDLRYINPRRVIQLRGQLRDKYYAFTVRMMPDSSPETRPGLGVFLSGTGKSIKVRLAKGEELLGAALPMPESAPADVADGEGEPIDEEPAPKGLRKLFGKKAPIEPDVVPVEPEVP